jgi:hypothetical protein
MFDFFSMWPFEIVVFYPMHVCFTPQVMRLLEDKASLVGEMNSMNDSVERLATANADLQRQLQEAHHAQNAPGAKTPAAATRQGAGAVERGRSGSRRRQGWTLDGHACPPPSKLRFTVRAHHSEANAVGYSKVDPVLFTADSGGSVKVWEAAAGRCAEHAASHTPTRECTRLLPTSYLQVWVVRAA